MLREIAIADAYGAGFEFASRERVAQLNDLSAYYPHGRHGFVAKYTDDTQMSLAIAEHVLSGAAWSKLAVADRLVAAFKRDPRPGYSDRFYRLLCSVGSGEELLEQVDANSRRNGAAIRVAPIGYLNDSSSVIAAASLQAKVTHDTEEAVRASCAVALVAHLGLHRDGRWRDIPEYLENCGFGGWDYEWRAPVSVSAYESVSAALGCLLRNDSISALIKESVSLGGDTDSVAAIAAALASCFRGYETRLPETLVDALDEPLYGLGFLDAVDHQLRSSRQCPARC